MNYKKYSDKEILESYTTALDYSGKADKDLVTEIDNRGGIDQLKTTVDQQNIVPKEIQRINKLVSLYYKDKKYPDEITSLIKSDILSPEDLYQTIEIAIKNVEHNIKDAAINPRTIMGCVIGVLISSIIGACIWCYSIMQTGTMYYILIPGFLLISYVIIRLLTGQSNNNVFVFISTFVSVFIAIILGLFFYKLLVA